MATLIVFLMVDLLGIDPRLATANLGQASFFDRPRAASALAFMKSFVFRLILLGGLIFLGEPFAGFPPWWVSHSPLPSARSFFPRSYMLVPSVNLRMGAFAYRIMRGYFLVRFSNSAGLPSPFTTHALYDIYVFASCRL